MSKKNKAQVIFSRYSPALVVGAAITDNESGAEYAAATVTCLCRCGQSKNMPYCDGSHAASGYDGTTERTECRLPREYRGNKITVYFDSARCAKLKHCWMELPEVFDPDKRPWINPDGAEPEKIIAVIAMCDSGALSYSYPDGVKCCAPSAGESIRVRKGGPLCCNKVAIIDDQDSVDKLHGSAERVCLCRCGQSKNKPFCDGAHNAVEFE